MNDEFESGGELRRRAEERLDPARAPRRQLPEEIEASRLVYELKVHQIELEMQNEELRRARDQVEALLARYTDLYDFAPVGYLTFDQAGVITQVNLTAARMLGVDRSWLVHRGLGLFLGTVDRAAFTEFMRTAFGSDERATCELTSPQKNGPPVVLRLEGARTDKGNECRAVLLDITARKEADRAIHLRSAALHAAANAMIITDRKGTIEWVNAGFTNLTGYAAEEALGRNPRELVRSGAHDQPFYKNMWDTILRGDVWHGEITNRRKDGTLYLEERTITPFKDEQGEVVHFIAIGRDLTEQRSLESQLLQAHKMETVGRLAGGIAHDFNNLLTVINGTVELMMLDVARDDPFRADLKEVRDAGARAALLTRQLLAFSRKQVMKFDVVDLNDLIVGVQEMLRRLIGEDIKLVLTTAARIGCVRADPTQIEQVLLNLSVNARDAMPSGGTLTFSTANVRVSDVHDPEHPTLVAGEYVLLQISDTGAGMSDAIRRRVFEPFFTTKGPGKGTGLGLSMVYGIVRQSGGSIYAKSEPGSGTTFSIYLPRVEAVSKSVTPLSSPAATPGTETVLLVEDEVGVRRVAERVLALAGYTVMTASNGEDAIKLLTAHDGAVSLMLTDMVMPGIGGWELAERCRELRPQMKVIFTSGYSDDAVLYDGRLGRNFPFIGKPYSASELTRLVREVLDA